MVVSAALGFTIGGCMSTHHVGGKPRAGHRLRQSRGVDPV